MKICFFGDADSIHIHRWCNYFKSLNNDVFLISFRATKIDGIKCFQVHNKKIVQEGGNWKVLFSFLKVRKILKEINPDIFHSMYATSYGITGALCSFKPYVITALGSDVLISPKQSKIYRILLKFAFKRATWITAMADHMKDEIVQLGIDENKVTTVPFGIDPIVFNQENRSNFGDKLRIISTRNFEEVYNIQHFLNSLLILKEKNIPFEAKLIGDGSLKNEFQAFIKEHNLVNEVFILGKKTQKEIAEELKNNDVFVTVSISDGNNISLNEAMACGCICIASNIPANTQWIEHGVNGFLVEIDDVNTLADQFIFAFEDGKEFWEKSNKINQKIIEEKAIWSNNMKKVEEQYIRLINAK